MNSPNISDEEKKSYGSSLDEMVIFCNYNMQKCNESNFEWFYDSRFGNCFRFNSVDNLITYSGGKMNGLNLKLFIDHASDLYDGYTSSLGAQVFVHNRSVFPSIYDGFALPIGMESSIIVGRKFTSRLPAPFSDCIDSIDTFGSVFTKFFTENRLIYSQEKCFSLCFQRKLTDVCGCFDTSMSQMSFRKRACLNYSDFKCSSQLFSDFYNNRVIQNCSQECPLECLSQIVYPTSITYSDFSVSTYNFVLLSESSALRKKYFGWDGDLSSLINKNYSTENELKSLYLRLKDIFSKKVLSLNVYYDDLVFTSIEVAD